MALLHPDADLSMSLIAYGADVIRLLRLPSRPKTVDHLLERYLARDKRRTPQSFFATLDMLFALEVISVSGYKVHLLDQVRAPAPRLNYTPDLFGDNDA